MFFGTTPAIISQFIHSQLKATAPKKAVVPFAGNFVVEQVAGLTDKAIAVHSTDVSLYSRAIGHGLAGQEMRLDPKPEALATFPHLSELTTPLQKAAGLIFLTEAMISVNRRHIAYYDSIAKDAIARHRDYIAKILTKLEAFAANLGDFTFHGHDACRLIPYIKSGDFVFYDPPVLLGDYEKMFKPVEAAYDIDPEPYTVMTDEIKAAHLAYLNEVGALVLYRTNNPITPPAGYTQVFDYMYKWGATYCVYANFQSRSFVGRFSPLREAIRAYPVISKSDVITANSEVQFLKVSGKVGNHYRMLWVRKAEMTDTGISTLFFVDGKLIGMASIASGLKFGTDLALLVSDPAAPSSQYARLSKLIIMLISTQEYLTWFNDETLWPHEGFTTRVFSHEPVSMKYRGVFELASRSEHPEDTFRYRLIYHNRKLMPTLKDALKEWVKRFAKVGK